MENRLSICELVLSPQLLSLSVSPTTPKNMATPFLLLPSEFDVNMTDITEDTLNIVADDMGMDPRWRKKRIHMFDRVNFPVEGIIYGPNQRVFIPLVVETVKQRKKQENRHAIFIMVTASPYTFLTSDVLSELGLFDPDYDIPRGIEVDIQGRTLAVHLSHGQFSHVNILGMDYLAAIALQLNIHYPAKTVTICPPPNRDDDDAYVIPF